MNGWIQDHLINSSALDSLGGLVTIISELFFPDSDTLDKGGTLLGSLYDRWIEKFGAAL